jgi:hypothetical protein
VKNILVTGSRDWVYPKFIEGALRSEYEEGCILHHGKCTRGADAIADAVARRLGIEVCPHPAEWDRHGRRAGFVRNAEMVALKPDVVLAFQVNRSKGTQHTIDLAKAAGIPVKGWRLDWFEE